MKIASVEKSIDRDRVARGHGDSGEADPIIDDGDRFVDGQGAVIGAGLNANLPARENDMIMRAPAIIPSSFRSL